MGGIVKGDLVQVIRFGCCGLKLGHVFIVADFWEKSDYKCSKRCGGCETEHNGITTVGVKNRIAVPLAWVMKINPHALESTIAAGSGERVTS